MLNEFNETDSPAKFCSRHASISCNTELSLCVSIEIGMSIEISVWLKKYAEDEAYAKANKLGLWTMKFEYPWKWRKKIREDNK